MKILLDTQALILAGQNDLPAVAKEHYLNSKNQIFFSLVSFWEMGIKARQGKLHLKRDLSRYYQDLLDHQGLRALTLEVAHIAKGVSFPFHHKDPFDRLLIGQAFEEKCAIMTGDSVFEKYGCKIIWN